MNVSVTAISENYIDSETTSLDLVKLPKEFILSVDSDRAPSEKYNAEVKVIADRLLPDWHPGVGNKPWIFIDEILIY